MSGVGSVLFPRPKNTSKLSTRIDADGKEVEVTRDDLRGPFFRVCICVSPLTFNNVPVNVLKYKYLCIYVMMQITWIYLISGFNFYCIWF
jgi:hypothetical protein